MPAARLSPRLAPLRAGIAGPGRPATALALALVLAGCGGAHDGERRTFRLSGSVSGEHVSGVTVQLTGTQTATTTTDAAGAYAFEGLPAGHYTLTAPPAGGYAFSPASLEVDVSSDADGLNFTSTPVFSLSGTVSGAARSGIPIRLSGTRSATTLTDDAGNYAFNDLPAGEYAVTPIVAAPYTVAPAAIELILVGPDLNGQDFVVSETYSVSGTIAGPAVLGVRVNLLGAYGQPIASTTPDALGHYAFDGLAGGSYIIVPSLDGFVFSPERRMVTTGSTIPQDFAEIGACAIEGTVSGLDPANHSIVLSGPVTATVTTDATGHYAFTGLPPGSYTVTPSTMGGFAFDPSSRSVSATAGTASSQDFLSSGAFHVSGVITGARASGVTVNLSGRQTASATTDASGRYDFGNLPEGTYTVTPAPGSGYVSTPANASVNVSHNSTVGDFTVAGLYAISGKISGPVVEGVTVSLSGPGRQATTRTDSAGRYAFSDLGDGAYAVVPSVEGGYRFLPPRHDVQLAGASAAGQDFQEVGINTISGRVSGQIAAGVTVLLSGGATATTTTDAKGDYSFPDLPNGSYAVTPSSKDGYVFTPDQRPVSLTGWGASYQDFSAAGAYRITGTLTGLRTAYVSLALSGARTDTTSSGVGGQFTFASLANGTYTITPVLSDGYVSTPSSWTVQVNGADVARDFAVTGAYQIHGKVSGPAASGVTVTASGPASRTASPDAGGYALPGLPNGTYLLAISGPPGVAFTPTRAVVRVTGASLLQDFAGESYAVTEAAVPTADAAPFSIASGRTGTSGSPSGPPAGSAGSRRRGRSTSSRSPTRPAPTGSWPGRTARSGSRRPGARRSAGSRPAATCSSTPSPPAPPGTTSRSGRTATCGSPKPPRTGSGAWTRPPGWSRSSPCPATAAAPSGSPPARTATSG
jgi:hypothetical protein